VGRSLIPHIILNIDSSSTGRQLHIVQNISIFTIERKNMQSQLSDTSKQFEKIYINLLQKKTFAQKFKQIESISSFVIGLSKKAIQNANQTLNKQEQDMLFVKYHYGDELYSKVKKYIEKLGNG